MPTTTNNLFLLQDLEDVSRTGPLAENDLRALHTVADWIQSFVARPNSDLGRAGPVCPFVPEGLERKTLWLAPEQIADRSAPDVVQLVDDYKRLFSRLRPTEGNGLDYKAIVVVFTDMSPDRARGSMDDVRQHLAAYREDGIVLAEFYEGNERTAIYNPSFRPFTRPVPFLLVRHAVISDWKLFL